MKKILLESFILIFLVGCATDKLIFYPTKSGLNFNVDKYDCVQQSRTPWSGGGTGGVGLAMIAIASSRAQNESDELFKMCMEARGWSYYKEGQKPPKSSTTVPTTAPTTEDLVQAKKKYERKRLEYEKELNTVGTPAFCAKNANGYDRECNRNTNNDDTDYSW